MATVVGSYLLVQDYKCLVTTPYSETLSRIPSRLSPHSPPQNLFRRRLVAFKRVFSERLETEGDWEREGIEFRERDDLDFLGECFGLVAEECR